MTNDEIQSATLAEVGANTEHEDARNWYDSYGWHLTTEAAGDVVMQAVEYDWLDGGDDDEVVRRLMAEHEALTADEAESIVERARSIRDVAEGICSQLDEAVAAYERRDREVVREALSAARRDELDHGDAPATDDLARRLLVETGD